MGVILEHFTSIRRLVSGDRIASAHYSEVIKRLNDVTITRISDLPEELIESTNFFISVVSPKAKQCFKNAQEFTVLSKYKADVNVRYVDGFFLAAGILPVEHAFNLLEYKGKEYYIDITAESQNFFNNDNTQEYASIGVYTKRQVLKHMEDKEEYSSIAFDEIKSLTDKHESKH